MKHINILGYIEDENSKQILKEILGLVEEEENADNIESLEPLVVNINSGGGELNYALAIYDLLTSLKRTVITRTNGVCMSAGVIIFLAGDTRQSYKNTQFMIHELLYSAGFEKLCGHGVIYTHFEELQKRVNNIICSKTRIDEDTLKDKMDWYLFPECALSYGIANSLI